MSKINILDSSIYNRISAGEVVERPASVVKELIENSLDAGAKSVLIEIENGGINLIKITDDGSGIEFDDLKKVFLPHATSKVSKLEDLEGINTFGFRGEALASIASVSKVEIVSNTKDQEVGGKVECKDGKISTPIQHASPVGTTIQVKNLFYNTPARFKFLKTPKQEEGLITNIINRLMLANPNVYFKYIVDGKVVYNANTKTLKDKLYCIYGKTILDNVIEVKAEKNGYLVTGYISKPAFCKANRSYQTLLINNRYVMNNLVGVAVSNAYENFLMKGKFPLYVLNIKMNFDDVDVNVHPSKMEVKFKNSNQIYSLIYSIIIETLNNNNFPASYENSFINVDNKFINNQPEHENDVSLKKVEGGFSFSALNNIKEELSKITIATPKYADETNNEKLNSSTFNFAQVENNNIANEEQMNKNLFEDNSFASNPSEKPLNKQEKFALDINYKIIGTIFNTYIVLECEDEIYMLDQHAGHERVLFDKFIKEFNDKKVISQDLLVPYIFNVNELEKDLLLENTSVFKDLGFNIESFGMNTFRITSIPTVLDGINLEEFVFDALKNLFKISKENEVIKNHFATCACKAAVKGGQKLSEGEIETLLKLIINNKTTLLCPHGRPICLKLTKNEIEKMFKRIV